MSNIKNIPTITEPDVQKVRSAMHHRAQWLYLILDEAEKAGLNIEDAARLAMGRCGCFQGAGLREDCTDPEDLASFAEVFADPDFMKYFEMEMVEANRDRMQIRFHHCPLVAGWQAIGCSDEQIQRLCDIAMDGDRGIAKVCGYRLTLGDTIAKGGCVCDITFTKE